MGERVDDLLPSLGDRLVALRGPHLTWPDHPEYIIGVLVMPPLIACLWIGVFGSAALPLELQQGAGLAAATEENITTALFKQFDLLPLSPLLYGAGLSLIFIFLITPANSASCIVAQLTDRGSSDPPLAKRLTWGNLVAATCLTLIAMGALPFSFLRYAMIWAVLRELASERRTTLEELDEKHDKTPVGASIEEARRLTDCQRPWLQGNGDGRKWTGAGPGSPSARQVLGDVGRQVEGAEMDLRRPVARSGPARRRPAPARRISSTGTARSDASFAAQPSVMKPPT